MNVLRKTMPTRRLIGPQPMAWEPSYDTDIRRLFGAVRVELQAQEYASDAGPAWYEAANVSDNEQEEEF